MKEIMKDNCDVATTVIYGGVQFCVGLTLYVNHVISNIRRPLKTIVSY